MLIYIIIFLSSILLAFIAEKSKKNKPVYYTLIFTIITFLSIFAGIRDIGVGTDTNIYSEAYFNVSKSIHRWSNLFEIQDNSFRDIGYICLNKIASTISNEIGMALFITELLILSPIFYVANKYNNKKQINIAVFTTIYLFSYYNLSLNIMRQSCAVSLIFLSYYFCTEKKWISTFITLAIAFTFHSTTVIAILIFIFHYISSKYYNHQIKILFVCIFIMLLIYLNYYYFLQLAISKGFANEYFIEAYGQDSMYEASSRITKITYISIFINSYTIYLSYKYKILSNTVHFFWILCFLFNAMAIHLSLYLVFLSRIGYPFNFICMYFTIIVLSHKKISSTYKFIYYFIIVFSWYYSYIYLNNSETYPYTSKFLGV